MKSDYFEINGKLYLKGYDMLKNDTTKEDANIFLKKYYRNKKRIDSINKQIEKLESIRIFITGSLENTEVSDKNISISTDIKGISYDGVGTSSGYSKSSYIESALVGEITKFEKTLIETEMQIWQLHQERSKLELSISKGNIFIEMLDERQKEILAKKYVENKSNLNIGVDLFLSEGSIRKHLNIINKTYGEWVFYSGGEV